MLSRLIYRLIIDARVDFYVCEWEEGRRRESNGSHSDEGECEGFDADLSSSLNVLVARLFGGLD